MNKYVLRTSLVWIAVLAVLAGILLYRSQRAKPAMTANATTFGYHRHMARRREIARRRHLSDEALLVHIRAAYAENRGAYGWPRIWRQLRTQGIRVGKQRVQRLMQQHGIRVRGKRRFRVTTTDSRHDLPIAPNLLNRNFRVFGPDQAWAGDITYVATEEGWLFLAVVIDLFSRRVVGWSMQPDMRRTLVIDALEMAWFRRSPSNKAGLIFHSDRGSQYASDDFNKVLKEHGITPSMSRKGNCWDNACSGDAVRFAESRTTVRSVFSNNLPGQG
jgi:putative transposase